MILPEYNIEVEKKFEMLMAVQDVTPDNLATQTRDTLISSGHTLLYRKGHKKQGLISKTTPRLIEERLKLYYILYG